MGQAELAIRGTYCAHHGLPAPGQRALPPPRPAERGAGDFRGQFSAVEALLALTTPGGGGRRGAVRRDSAVDSVERVVVAAPARAVTRPVGCYVVAAYRRNAGGFGAGVDVRV